MVKQTRRDFLEQSILAAAAVTFASMPKVTLATDEPQGSKSPNEKLHVALIGVNGRGHDHMQWLLRRSSDCEIVAIVDVDEAVGKSRVEGVKKQTGKTPTYYRDLRKMLENPSVDVVSIATPNHWHSLAAIWAVQAGKDIYVEKPVSHNVSEGRRLVQAARKHNRIVQAGTQSRSLSGAIEAVEFLRSGKIGDVKLARGLCYKTRNSIGPKGIYEVPKSVDYDLWLGPASKKPLTRRSLHYDWHWIWDYGNGDLGNQGIHQMDVCRWGLGVGDIGTGVLSYGGRFGYVDAGETANTQISIHDYADGKRIVFEVRGLKTPKLLGTKIGAVFYGTEGYVVVGEEDYGSATAYDLKGNEIKRFQGGSAVDHWKNFTQAVRSRKREVLNGEILEGHLSSALCHLANISYRSGQLMSGTEAAARLADDKETSETFERFSQHLAANSVLIQGTKRLHFGRKLELDPKSEVFTGDAVTGSSISEVNAMLTREYRVPFVVPAEKDV
jgi:predicted dehydrogenase